VPNRNFQFCAINYTHTSVQNSHPGILAKSQPKDYKYNGVNQVNVSDYEKENGQKLEFLLKYSETYFCRKVVKMDNNFDLRPGHRFLKQNSVPKLTKPCVGWAV
jgi:hypothetical protein